MHLTIGDGKKIFGTLYLNEKLLAVTSSLRYNLKPLTIWSIFGCSRNVARVLLVSVNTGTWRDYEFHVPESSADLCIENIMHQIDELFFFEDMPDLVASKAESDQDKE